jgi:hypothetical protein
MKIILTEQQTKKLLDEEYNEYYYDIILDKYNDVGEAGMNPDEIDYLKSHGESPLPKMFDTEEDVPAYNIDSDTDSEDDLHKGRLFSEIMDAHGYEYKKLNEETFIIKMTFDKVIYDMVMEIFGDTDSTDSNGKTIRIRINEKTGVLGIGFPVEWYNIIFGELE